MLTLSQPVVIGSGPPPASMTWSPTRVAARPLMFTVALPRATTPAPWGDGPLEAGHWCVSGDAAAPPPGPPGAARQAGALPMFTLGLPGPGPSLAPWAVVSP